MKLSRHHYASRFLICFGVESSFRWRVLYLKRKKRIQWLIDYFSLKEMVRYRNALSKLSDFEGGCSFNTRMHPLTYSNKNIYNMIQGKSKWPKISPTNKRMIDTKWQKFSFKNNFNWYETHRSTKNGFPPPKKASKKATHS